MLQRPGTVEEAENHAKLKEPLCPTLSSPTKTDSASYNCRIRDTPNARRDRQTSSLLTAFQDVFAFSPEQLGRTSLHTINTGSHPQIRLNRPITIATGLVWQIRTMSAKHHWKEISEYSFFTFYDLSCLEFKKELHITDNFSKRTNPCFKTSSLEAPRSVQVIGDVHPSGLCFMADWKVPTLGKRKGFELTVFRCARQRILIE